MKRCAELEHAAPGWGRRLLAEAKERERGLGDDGAGDGERRLYQERRHDVGQHVAQGDAPVRIADGARGFDIVLDLGSNGLPARQADEDRRGGDADGDHRIAEAGAEEGREGDGQDQEWDGEHGIDNARQQRSRPSHRRSPRSRPRGTPKASAMPTDTRPALSEARAPQMMRERTSRPTSSVPSQWAHDGALRTALQLVAIGS